MISYELMLGYLGGCAEIRINDALEIAFRPTTFFFTHALTESKISVGRYCCDFKPSSV